MSHVFFASATGFQQIEPASRLVIRQNAFARLYVLSAISCIYISITYLVAHAACSIGKEYTVSYISATRDYVYVLKYGGSLLSFCYYKRQQ